jgi:segregation and condensation protein B
MPSKLDELVFQVEAILFAAGKPMSVKELTSALGLEDFRPVQRAVRTLEQTYAHRQSALEVRRVGDRFALQLQEPYVGNVQAVTPVEMAPRTLKALTLVAYHQPILQSVLVRMMGEVTYEEVQHLRGLGLVHTEPKGATLELTTTRRFAEYFGIASTRPEEIRRFLEDKLGVVPPPPPATPTEVPVGTAAKSLEIPTPPPGAEGIPTPLTRDDVPPGAISSVPPGAI